MRPFWGLLLAGATWYVQPHFMEWSPPHPTESHSQWSQRQWREWTPPDSSKWPEAEQKRLPWWARPRTERRRDM